jgi:hypothetical protein
MSWLDHIIAPSRAPGLHRIKAGAVIARADDRLVTLPP